MPVPRLFRIAILAEVLLFFGHVVASFVGFDHLPEPVRDEMTRLVMGNLDGSIRQFGLALLEFVFLLTALAGLYFYARFARTLWWIALVLSGIELAVQPFVSEPGWIAALGGLGYAGYGLITALLWHPEIRARFKDHSTTGRRRLKIAFATAGLIALAAAGSAMWLGVQILKRLPPDNATPILNDIALDQSSEPSEILSEIDRVADAYLATATNAGIAIGVTRGRGRERVFTAKGVLSKKGAGGEPITADTLFEIGSVTKVFTALLTAEAVAEGVIQLDQPVSDVLGDAASLPMIEAEPITFLDLATHYAGFPKMPDNLPMQRQFAANPYADYSEANLFAAVSSLGEFRRNGDPRRRRYRYSNLGYSLLAHAVARAREQPLEEAYGNLFARLEMTNTYFSLPDEARHLLAAGHNRGFRVGYWYDGGALIQGAGNIVSSVADQLTWLEANLDPPEGSLGEGVRLMAEPRRPAQMPNVRIGIGWHFTGKKTPIVWHNGATGGFRSIVLWFPDPKLGVVVLGNSSDDAVDRIGFLLIRALLQKEQEEEAERDENKRAARE